MKPLPKRILLWLAGFALLGALVAVRAPSAWLAASLPALSDGRLRLADPEGCLWKGKGRLFLVTANGTIHPLGPISWSFSSAGLTALEASWRIEGKHIGAESAWIGPRRFGFRELHLSLPAAVALAAAGPHGLAPGLHGDLAITIGKLDCPWPRPAEVCDLQAMARWEHAGHDALTANTLADYQFALDAKAGTLQMSWSTIAGRPEIRGQGEFGAGRWTMNAEVIGDPESLTPLIRLFPDWVRPGARSGELVLSAHGKS